jgi:hypothetical protein
MSGLAHAAAHYAAPKGAAKGAAKVAPKVTPSAPEIPMDASGAHLLKAWKLASSAADLGARTAAALRLLGQPQVP